MEIRRFERLGRTVSRLGLAATGLYKRPDVSPLAVARAIGEGIDRGIDLIDTAPYLGHSEEVCGQTLRELGAWEKVTLATHVPPASELAVGKALLADDEGETFNDPLPRVWAPEYLEERIERSLRETRLEVIPLALLDGWHDSWLASTAWPEIKGAMVKLQRKGKVLRWGLSLSIEAVPHTEKVLDEPLISAVAAPYCLWTTAAEKLAAAASERGVPFLAQMVMGQGGLTGEIVATAEFAPGDIRRQLFDEEKGKLELSRRLGELAGFTKSSSPAARSSELAKEAMDKARRAVAGQPQVRECETVAELALRFAISTRHVASAVVGMSSAEHLRANVAAVERGALPDYALEPVREWMSRYT